MTRGGDFVPLEGASNFRDAGGHEPPSGGRVRHGMLFRANRLSKLTDADHGLLAGLGIATVYDLREEGERARAPTRWPGPELHAWPDPQGHQPWSNLLMRQSPDAAGARAFILDLYRRLPEFLALRIAEIARSIGDRREPVVIHCSAGKDRTGVAIGILLAMLGVSREAILADYLLSAHRLGVTADQRAAFHRREGSPGIADLPPEAVQVLHSAEPEFLTAAFDIIDARHGSLDHYLRDAGQLDAQSLRRYRDAMIE